MTAAPAKVIGVGIYSVPEASRLARVSAPRIHRWLRGYSFRSRGRPRRSPPVWRAEHGNGDLGIVVGFRDLLEVRFVNAFRNEGVSWRTLRSAAARGARLLRTSHPFCMNRFMTDGREIFIEILKHQEDKEPALLEISKSQVAFRSFCLPYLRDVDFKDQLPQRWWPMGKNHSVVVDPGRALGKPIVEQEGVPTRVLAKAVSVEKSIRRVASWYEVAMEAVGDAVEFEKSLAA